jgi:hypothetical protein
LWGTTGSTVTVSSTLRLRTDSSPKAHLTLATKILAWTLCSDHTCLWKTAKKNPSWIKWKLIPPFGGR